MTDKRGWNASWIETRDVTGVVYATSKTDAERRIRSGEGHAIGFGAKRCLAPMIRGERTLWLARAEESEGGQR